MTRKIMIFILGIISFMTQTIKAQEYLPMLQENRIWSVSDEKYTLIGDTLIDDVVYHKVYYHKKQEEFVADSLTYICALREETQTGKVWMVWKDTQDEYLLYNFAVEAEEVVEVYPAWYDVFDNPLFDPYAQEFIIEEVLLLEIEGVQRKVIRQNSPDSFPYGTTYNEIWIEGIGSTSGLLYAGITSQLIMDFAYPDLLCLYQQEVLLFQSNEHPNSCYNVPATNIETNNSLNAPLKSFPNPFTDYFHLEVENGVQFVSVINTAGKTVYRITVYDGINSIHIPTREWIPGIYIVLVQYSDRNYAKKIVKY